MMILADTHLLGIGQILFGLGAVLTPVLVTVNLVVTRDGRKHARETNDAVNNVHATGGERIYDMVLDARNTAEKGFLFTQQQHGELRSQVAELGEKVDSNAGLAVDAVAIAMDSQARIKDLLTSLDVDDDYPDGVTEEPG